MDRIHDRMNDFLEHDYERDAQITAAAISKHEEAYHNPVKTWTIFGGIAAVLAIVIEAIKWLAKKGV